MSSTLRSGLAGWDGVGCPACLNLRVLFHVALCAWVGCATPRLWAQTNLLKNPGFEQEAGDGMPSGWTVTADSRQRAAVSASDAHGGQRCGAIPAFSSIEQQVGGLKAGAYLARGWVKSEAEQSVTLLLWNPDRPWAAYNYAEVKVPKGQWAQVEVFCPLDEDGSLTFMMGGVSKEFRAYHGPEGEMRAPIQVDDFELTRYERSRAPTLTFVDAPGVVNAASESVSNGRAVTDHTPVEFAGTPSFIAPPLAGLIRRDDGSLIINAISEKVSKPRGVITPAPAFKVGKCDYVRAGERTGVRVSAEQGDRGYTAWISKTGLVTIEPNRLPSFSLKLSQMSYGILPSFVGSDVLYAPARMPGISRAAIPSTQWFVGLMAGGDSMLVAVWESPSQPVSLGLSGQGEQRVIDDLRIGTEQNGFACSFVEHQGLWHREPLKEDYLEEYTPIAWQRPFPARWMAEFFVSPGGRRSFREPHNDYAFPMASAKTRMWGVWFEDWNHYPFYFDGARTVVHFEKSFIPQGDALFYFLEPAAADLCSPCEIVQQVLGPEKSAALFDWDGNGLRKLKYSTPDLFLYDRPVCATTTRLSQIKGADKPTVGVNLATHLFEFIREIRARVDQYSAYFAELKEYLEAQKATHPEVAGYVAELERLVVEAQSQARKTYATPLAAVQAKIDLMKQQLQAGRGDGYNCGNLDVRGPAGEQDDLCRRYNRVALQLVQFAALNCGDSEPKAVIAQHIWDQSRLVLQHPTRWESRRTLYFFEP